MPGSRPQVGPLQKRQERALDIRIAERSAIVVDKNMIVCPTDLTPSKEVLAQPCDDRIMQGHETCFPELRLADQQSIGRDIGELQTQCFGDLQACGEQEAEQRSIGSSPHGASWTKATSRFDEPIDLLRRVDVWEAAIFRYPK